MYNNNFYGNDWDSAKNESDALMAGKKAKSGKTAALLLAAALLSGSAGFGGGYLANRMFGNESVPADAPLSAETESRVEPLVSTKTQEEPEPAPLAAVKPSETGANTDEGLPTVEIIDKITPSVVAVTAKFSNGQAGGTGIILSEDGYVITNAHVVENEVVTIDDSDPFSGFFGGFGGFGGFTSEIEKAYEIAITLSDGREFKTTLIGFDAAKDIAVLKADASDLTAAPIGDSSTLKMGEKVVTLGYPLGLGLTASDGIISGLDRVAGDSKEAFNAIQTDAIINSGNSGGPLLNANAEVIGITYSKLVDRSDAVEGVGFAIPITEAMTVIQDYIDNPQKYDIPDAPKGNPKMGITGMSITPEAMEEYDITVESGVYVVSVDEDSAAERAGIKEGDVITKADGVDIASVDELNAVKSGYDIGDSMTLTIVREGSEFETDIVFSELL